MNLLGRPKPRKEETEGEAGFKKKKGETPLEFCLAKKFFGSK